MIVKNVLNDHQDAVLNEAKVRVIRLSHLPDNVWAKKFGVSRATIQYARSGRSWKHVKNPPPVHYGQGARIGNGG